MCGLTVREATRTLSGVEGVPVHAPSVPSVETPSIPLAARPVPGATKCGGVRARE